jgi:hypothetical protein
MHGSDFSKLYHAVKSDPDGALEVQTGVKAINAEAGPAYV